MSEHTPEQMDALKKLADQMSGLPPFFEFVAQNTISALAQRYMDEVKRVSREQGQPVNFPLAEYGLSCYIQAMNEMFDILDALDFSPEEREGETEDRQQALEAFKEAKQGYLQLKFQPPGNVVEEDPPPAQGVILDPNK